MEQKKTRKIPSPQKSENQANIAHQDLRALTKEIKLWREELRKSDLWYKHLAQGMVRGLGTLMGATIVAGILFLLLNQFIEKTGLENLVNPEFLEQLLKTK